MGNDRNLFHRGAVGLAGCHQGMTDLVVSRVFLFLFGNDHALALVAGNDDIHRLFQVHIGHLVPFIPHRAEGRLVDDVGQFRAAGAGGRAGDLFQIDIVAHLHIFGMNFQDSFTTVQVRQFHRNTAVKPARPQQGRVQGFRTVGSRQDDDALTSVKTVHLRQQLVQGLFPFIVAAESTVVTFFADGIDFIDKYDTGSLFLGFLEQVTDTGRAHAYEHFNKFGTGNAEERHLGLTGNGLGQQGLTGTGRSNQQGALRHGSADSGIFSGIMQEVHQLHQGFLRLVLTGHIRKGNTGLGLHVHLGIALAEVAHAAETFAAHITHQQLPDDKENNNGQDPVCKNTFQGTAFPGNNLGKLHLAFSQLLYQLVIFHPAGDVNLFVIRVLSRSRDPLFADLNLAKPAFVHHLDKGIIGQLGNLRLEQGREHVGVQQHQYHQRQDVVVI